MKKVLVGITLASSLVLAACGGGGPEDPKIPGPDSGSGTGAAAQMSPVFSPASGNIPIPNDLLFSGTEDLTLNIPNDDPSASNPITAINSLDGWSTHAPFTISFSDNGATLDSASLAPGQNFRIFKTSVLRPEVQPGIISPTGPVSGIESELTFGVDYVVQAVGPLTLAVVPLKPFEAQASYMVVLTNGLQDSTGTALTGDSAYNLAKLQTPLEGATAALEPVRQLVDAMLNAAETVGVAREDAILSYQFTVQSVADTLVASKGVYIDLPIALSGNTVFPATNFSSLMTDTTPFTGIGAANLYKGQLTLPYLSGVPSQANPLGPLNDNWVAADMVPVDGQFVPNPLAGGNLTYANPLPQKRSDEMVPLLVSLPKNPQCAKPYPVMIFQHGITSNRTAMLGIADTMAGACTAVVSMDQPLHGITADNPVHLGLQAASGGLLGIFEGYTPGALRERTFGVDYVNNDTSAPGPDGNVDSSGTHTINLANLLVSRDNLRQASLDLLTLEKAIPAMDIDGDMVPDLDSTKVSFMGHSLGGIVGSTYTSLSDFAQQSVIATASGSIAQMLNGSDSFGPRIRAGVAAAAGQDPASTEFLSDTLPTFLFAAQTAIDSGDPINYAGIAIAKDTPTLAIQVKGDTVVPNLVAGAPLSGTTPMSAVYGLTTVTETTATSRGFLKFVSGNHATPLSPAGAGGATEFLAETTAMQTAIATFIATGGANVVVTDPALVEP